MYIPFSHFYWPTHFGILAAVAYLEIVSNPSSTEEKQVGLLTS